MNQTQLAESVKTLRASSAWTPGDPTTFAVPFLRREVELPAPSDPYLYIENLKTKLGLADLHGLRVGIMGAGFGGLVGALLDLGAAEVVAIEPRLRFRKGLERVLKLLNEVHPGEKPKATAFYGWPALDRPDAGTWPQLVETSGNLDAIIWPECLDECERPVETLAVVLKLLKPESPLFIEVRNGQNVNVPNGRINSWLPTNDTFNKAVKAANGAGFSDCFAGRATNRTIYSIRAVSPTVPTLPPPPSTLPTFPRDPKAPLKVAAPEQPRSGPEPLPPFPRDPALRTVHHIGLPAPAPTGTDAVAVAVSPAVVTEDEPVVILDLDDPAGLDPSKV